MNICSKPKPSRGCCIISTEEEEDEEEEEEGEDEEEEEEEEEGVSTKSSLNNTNIKPSHNATVKNDPKLESE
jgi:hypothetical protein